MTGLKSGSGDDLWDDDSDEAEANDESGAENVDDVDGDDTVENIEGERAGRSGDEATDKSSHADVTEENEDVTERGTGRDAAGTAETGESQPYIVRRAVQDKSIQFERDERLTFFVHEDVVDGERELLVEVESALGRDVPKFDVREAVYRAALRNPDDVLEELLQMGYALDDE